MQGLKAWGYKILNIGVRATDSIITIRCIQRTNVASLVFCILTLLDFIAHYGKFSLLSAVLLVSGVIASFGSVVMLNIKHYITFSRPLLMVIIYLSVGFDIYHKVDRTGIIQQLTIPLWLPVFFYPTVERKGLLTTYIVSLVMVIGLSIVFRDRIDLLHLSSLERTNIGLVLASVYLTFVFFKRFEKDFNDKQVLDQALTQKEIKARTAYEKLSAIYENSTDGILFLDMERFCVTGCNQKAVELFEARSKDEMIGKSAFDLSSTVVTDQEVKDALTLYKQLKDIRGEWRYETFQGKFFWGRYHALIIDTPEFSFAILTITDITQIKQSIEALEESQHRYRTIFEYSRDALFLLKYEDFTITDANRQAVELLNAPNQTDLLGLSISDFFIRKEDIEATESIFQFLFRVGHWESNKRSVTLKNSRTFWVNVSITRVKFGETFFWLARFTDIDTKKEQEEKLAEQKMKFASIFNHSVDALFILDPHTLNITDCNRQAAQEWHLSRYKIRGLSPNMLLAQPFLPQEWDDIKKTVRQFGRWEAELMNVSAKGAIFWGVWAIVKNGSGQHQFYLLRIQNTNERKLAEKQIYAQQFQLLQNIKQLREIQNFGRIGTWEYDAEEDRYHNSEELYRMLELPDQSETDFRIFKSMMTEAEYTSFRHELRIKLEAKKDFQIIWSVKLPSGKRKTLHNRSRVQLNEVGEIAHVSGVIMDISELKRYEVNLENTNARFRAVFENAPIAIWAIAPQDRILFHNSATAHFFGYEQSEMRHIPTRKLIHPDDFSIYEDKLNLLDEQLEHSVQFELRFTDRNGTILWGQVSVTVLPTTDSTKKYKVMMVADISLQKLREAELEFARELAESANRSKAEFLAHLSHDLRNPLNGIFGSARMMEDVLTNAKQGYFLNLIRISAKKLTNSITNILDYSKLEAGKLELHLNPFNLKSLTDETAALYTNLAHEKNLEFNYRLPDILVPYLIGDANLLSRILDNLLSNGIKFTHEGEVSFIVNQESPLPNGTVWTHFIIQDTGIGISPENQPYLFQPFKQLDASTTKQFQGTGLGLVIARGFAQEMGGNIVFEYREGCATSFICSIPFQKSVQNALPPTVKEPAKKVSEGVTETAHHPSEFKILIGEDDEVNSEYLFNLLRRWGYTSDVAYNGTQVLKRLQSKPYDMVLIDGAMPLMDGYETITAIREREKELGLPHIYIIGVTGYALAGDREKFLEAGADDYTTKPINEELLRSLIEKYLVERKKG